MDRGEFFGKAFTLLMGKAAAIVEDAGVGDLCDRLAPEPKPPAHRPPGASSDDQQFRQNCTGCDACMIACPVDVIMVEDLTLRHPLIYPHSDPCIRCEDTPCIASCPTAALKIEQEDAAWTWVIR